MISYAISSVAFSLCAIAFVSAEAHQVTERVEVFEVAVSKSEDETRVQISVFNTRANNARAITSYNQAERLGDLTVAVDGDETRSSELRKNYSPPRELVWQWISAGNGFGWSLPLDHLKSRYSLTSGCYKMRFSFTNSAAVELGDSKNSGPRALVASDDLRVCF